VVSPLPQNNYEAVRVLSYTLPCPPPQSPGQEVAPKTPGSARPGTARKFFSSKQDSAISKTPGSGRINARKNMTDKTSLCPTPVEAWIDEATGMDTSMHMVVGEVHKRYLEKGRKANIQISHAVAENFSLRSLPSTPPTPTGNTTAPVTVSSPSYFPRPGLYEQTPSSTASSPGYFPRIYNNAVVIPPPPIRLTSYNGPLNLDDYNSGGKSAILSPNTMVPDSSIHVSILERYIPPASPAEDQGLFNPASSILVDRLYELSPQGGSLLFIYPTKKGAEDFGKQYLGPVMDPILRNLMALYNVPTSLLNSISRMTAIEGMLEFDELKKKIGSLCKLVNASDAAELGSEDPEDGTPTPKAGSGIQIVHSSCQKVRLNCNVWPTWWITQETERINLLVKRHYASAKMEIPNDSTEFELILDPAKTRRDLSMTPVGEVASWRTNLTGENHEGVASQIGDDSSKPVEFGKSRTTSPISVRKSVMVMEQEDPEHPTPIWGKIFKTPGDLVIEILENVKIGALKAQKQKLTASTRIPARRLSSEPIPRPVVVEDDGIEIGVFVLRKLG
jgi:hypothetical protein